MQDYPAAHSMDTEWFAVDTSGNLAILDSGEGGAVPKSNFQVWQTAKIGNLHSLFLEMAKTHKNRLIELNIPGDVIAETLFFNEQNDRDVLFNRQNLEEQKTAQIYIEKDLILPLKKPINKWLYCHGWLLLLRGDEVITQLGIEEIEYNYAVRFSGESTVIFVRECNFEILQDLFEKGQILAGKGLNDGCNGFARLLGFFVYDLDSNDPLPYICIGKPFTPLQIEDLPEPLQAAMSWNKFERLQFNESETIQPIEHMPCDTWGNDKWWVDTQGQEHDQHPDRYPG